MRPIHRSLLAALCFSTSGCLGLLQPVQAQPAQSRQSQQLPHVVVLATGGTIAGTGVSDTQTAAYQSGVLTGAALIRSVPSLEKIARVSAEQVSNVGSDNITNEILLRLAKRVNALLAQPDVAGIVITHGTDTLEETAYFLNLVVKSDKPVVITGAMRPSTAISADGPSNILQAVKLAATPDARGRGVMIALSDRIGSARFATKTNANTLDTFQGHDAGYLGTLVDQNPYFETIVTKKHTTATPFDISKLETLPEVAIVMHYQSDTGFMYDAATAQGVKGIIAAGVGAGSTSLRSIPSIKKAIEQGVVVVRSSRTGSGFVPVDPAYPGLVADSLNPQKARILLMLALTITRDPERIQAMFRQF